MKQEIANIISKIKHRFQITENFIKATTGTNSQVFVSENFIIKINKNKIDIKNEHAVIRSLKSVYAPKILGLVSLKGCSVIVEKRIKGQDTQKIWKQLNLKDKKKIVDNLADAIFSFHKIRCGYFWSVKTNKKFKSYDQLLLRKFQINRKMIFNNPTAYNLYLKVKDNLHKSTIAKVFKNVKPVLVHGDLIMHNILINENTLSGIIDWEYAQFGDPFYDLARVIYYQECARDYIEQKRDINFEYDFTTRLINQLKKSIKFNSRKYKIIRSLYFIDSIIWALNSSNPKKNLKKLEPPTLSQLLGKN